MRFLLSAALMLGTVTGASAQLYDNAPRVVDQNSINNQFGAGNPYNGNRYRIIQGN